jgi:hypothetical protein
MELGVIGLSRRFVLQGLFAAPAVIQYGHLMPVRAEPLPYLPGDLIEFSRDIWRETGWAAVAEPLRRIEGKTLVFGRAAWGDEIRVPVRLCSLSHGLPGNRVNNPSMRHRLIRTPGTLGLRYPEDRP